MPSEAGRPGPDPLEALESRVIDHVFALQPGYAVFLGLHQYDGRLPDLGRSATDAWTGAADRLLSDLREIPADQLTEARRLDRTLLELLLESPRFDLHQSRDLDRNPMAFLGPVSLTAYMVRDYAPLPTRVDAMVRLLDGVPALLDAARHRLESVLPEPFVRLALTMAAGLPPHFEEAEAYARRASAPLGDRVARARAPAEEAVRGFLERLQGEWTRNATDDFALGPERYQTLLWVREGLRTPFEEMRRSGLADLKRNQARLEEIARSRKPPTDVPALLESLFRQHPSADRLIPRAQELVAETKRFVEEAGLVTVPSVADCRVEETPVYGRALSTASMNPPGPFDAAGDEGIYYVTPVDPAWPPERREEWLRSFNDPMLRNITIHEVYPGHYVQFLHFRRGANSFARKVFVSASFTEGWAHYCEQLAIEQGLGRGGPEAEVAQIHDALLRDCRLLASVGLHTGGMTLGEATELFRREAHFEQLPAEREAIRGTFNPEYFCYTLGKLAILEERARTLGPLFGGSLRAFHDRLLSFGSPPVGVLGALLGAPA